MSIIGNIFWILLVGFIPALIWLISGLLLCLTIIGIPFGIQCLKFARLTFLPFGSDVDPDFGAHPIMNLLWITQHGLFAFSLFEVGMFTQLFKQVCIVVAILVNAWITRQ